MPSASRTVRLSVGEPTSKLIPRILAVGTMLGVTLLALPSPANAQYRITEIIDSTGDGVHLLVEPFGVAVDSSGNVFKISTRQPVPTLSPQWGLAVLSLLLPAAMAWTLRRREAA